MVVEVVGGMGVWDGGGGGGGGAGGGGDGMGGGGGCVCVCGFRWWISFSDFRCQLMCLNTIKLWVGKRGG